MCLGVPPQWPPNGLATVALVPPPPSNGLPSSGITAAALVETRPDPVAGNPVASPVGGAALQPPTALQPAASGLHITTGGGGAGPAPALQPAAGNAGALRSALGTLPALQPPTALQPPIGGALHGTDGGTNGGNGGGAAGAATNGGDGDGGDGAANLHPHLAALPVVSLSGGSHPLPLHTPPSNPSSQQAVYAGYAAQQPEMQREQDTRLACLGPRAAVPSCSRVHSLGGCGQDSILTLEQRQRIAQNRAQATARRSPLYSMAATMA